MSVWFNGKTSLINDNKIVIESRNACYISTIYIKVAAPLHFIFSYTLFSALQLSLYLQNLNRFTKVLG